MSIVALPRRTENRQRYRPIHVARRLPGLLTSSLGSLVVCILLWGIWRATGVSVLVTVDGIEQPIATHRHTVAELLLDLGIVIHPNDLITPDPSTSLADSLTIHIERARLVQIWADGRDISVASWGKTPQAILEDAAIDFGKYDQVLHNGKPMGLTAELPLSSPEYLPSTYSRGYLWDNLRVEPLQLHLQRAVPITVRDGGLPFTVQTTALTVGEALRQAEITVYLGDLVQPSLGTQISPGLRIFIQRSKPVTLQVDGRTLKTRTRALSVGDALAEIGVGVSGLDHIEPPLTTALKDDLRIAITRVREDIEIEEEIVPYETVFEPDASLAIDNQTVVNAGAEGITRKRFRVRYEDGAEVSRAEEDTWVAQEPAQRVIAYGQRIEPQTATMPDGTEITYWRKIRMLASSYSAGTAGVAKDNPWYGRTYTGEPMRKGVVAVDPRIIPLRTQVYIPGYGTGDALDTGSAIRARRIDLGYDDDNLQLWNRWVDVYLLWPPPPTHQITWVLPNYPRVPN
ncbi:MAG TPA: ubiquitin-like domain-containing protein [Caldilineaceae bacterium]|nr:ubiquitin-like domain-containing protein [Caldilineaceae bacterium]